MQSVAEAEKARFAAWSQNSSHNQSGGMDESEASPKMASIQDFQDRSLLSSRCTSKRGQQESHRGFSRRHRYRNSMTITTNRTTGINPDLPPSISQ